VEWSGVEWSGVEWSEDWTGDHGAEGESSGRGGGHAGEE
jgi:hypothetical protein